jgi:glycerol-3-phosphate acyltransferase PlsY
MNTYVLSGIIGYLFGIIPFSFLVPKLMGNLDIRNYGSGNAGATNVYRVLGIKGGLLAFLGDFSKGFFAVLLTNYLIGPSYGIVAGLFAVIGHCYPATLKFKGGKGVATTAGLVFAVNPIIALILLVFQILIIYFSKIMSLASILSAIMFPVVAYFFNMDLQFIMIASFLGIFVIYRHRSNVKRLLKGEESKLNF